MNSNRHFDDDVILFLVTLRIQVVLIPSLNTKEKFEAVSNDGTARWVFGGYVKYAFWKFDRSMKMPWSVGR